jgi:4-hydroxybenzoate polyprenyltransferase
VKHKLGSVLSEALQFVLSNSIFLGLNGALVIVFACYLYGVEISSKLLLAAFLATFSVYCLNKVTDGKEDAINRSGRKPQKTSILIAASAIAMVISLTLGFTTSVSALIILAAPLIIGCIYSVQFTKSIPRLKEVVGVKSVVVAFSWALTGAFLPVTLQAVPAYKEVLVFFYVFAQLLVNTIIFDALDVKGDFISGIITVPIALGKKNTKKLLLTISGFHVIWLLYCFLNGVFINFLPTLAFGVFYEFAIILYFLRETRPRLLTELFVDGEWLPLVVLMRVFLR